MQRQSHDNDHQNQSDNDEGFIPSKIIIKEKKDLIRKEKNHVQIKKQFISRYISEGILRKQPVECYQRFSQFDSIEESITSQKSLEQEQSNLFIQSQQQIQSSQTLQKLSIPKSRQKQKLQTPYDKYIASSQYSLCYSRYKDFKFQKDEPNFANNQVKLDCLRSTQELKFKPIKPFEIIQEKTQSVLTQQGLNRNNSIRQSLLQFDSKFQCGNLLCAFKHKLQPYTYTLFIQNDTNSYGYNQWFYFSIKNAQPKIKYKFVIVNFRKRHSFFRQGNRPIVFSLFDSRKKGMTGYSKRGQNVKYTKAPIIKSYDSKEKFYQLSFQLEFYNEDDLCYISMGLPYSYSKLLNNLSLYEQIARENGIKWTFQSVSTTIAGNSVPYITITKMQQAQTQKQHQNSFKQNQSQEILQNLSQNQTQRHLITNNSQTSEQKKRVILIIGRQHPGQTWSSYLMDQFIYGLVTLSNPQSQYILSNFIIKCIPMINVDGVIMGNFRCDLTGMDLNRNWKNPSSLLHPQIFSIKNQIQNLTNQGYKIETCLDLHGHSKEYNVFCYSCKIDNVQCRILPYIFSEINPEFHFPSSTFGISRYKQSTARAVIFNIIKNTNVLTIQSSFFGSKVGDQFKIFQPKNFEKMAETLIKGCKSYFSKDGRYQASKQIVRLRLSQFLQFKPQNQNALSGSDSEPSADQIQLEDKLEKIIPKNLIQECIEVKSPKKSIKRVKKNMKRKTFQVPEDRGYRTKKQSFLSSNKNSTIDPIKDQSPVKETKSNWQTIRIKKKTVMEPRKTSNFKKTSMTINRDVDENSSSENTRMKFSIKDFIEHRQDSKLPFFSRDKPLLIPMKLKNQSLEIFKDAYNATEKYIKHNNDTSLDDVRNPKNRPSKRIGIFKEKTQKDTDQFPLLCVLSQNKKKTHVQKIKQMKEAQNDSLARQQKAPEKLRTAIQTRTQAIKKLRQKDKNSMQLVSKIWRQNFARYGMAFSTFKISK